MSLASASLVRLIRSTEGKATAYHSTLHKRGELPDLSWFDSYHDYADHLQYWDDLVGAFPRNSEKFEIGKSYENRSMHAFHLFGDNKDSKGKGKGHGRPGKHGEKESEKPIILWHATVHAREVRRQRNKLLTDTIANNDKVDLYDGYISCITVDLGSKANSFEVIEYLAYQLIDGYKSGDGNVTAFLDHYDFYLVPFHNPDGKLKQHYPFQATQTH